MIRARLSEAVAAHREGDVSRARELCEEVLRGDPCQADALQLLGLVEQESGDLVRARRMLEASIFVRPDTAHAHYNLAIVLTLQRDFTGAIDAYESAVTLLPLFAEAHNNLGNLYVQAGRLDDALRAYTAAIEAKPDFAAFYSNLGAALIGLGRYDEAIFALESAVQQGAEIAEAHCNLSQAYRRSGRFREAIAESQRALTLRPDYREACLNLAVAAFELDEFELAEDANRRALEIDPTSAQAYCNLGRVYEATGRYVEAIAAAEAAITLRPNYAEAHTNLAFALLVRGDFTRGWRESVWMWRLPKTRPAYPYLDRATLWNGEAFVGRTLLITREQGLGDAIQVARFLPAVKSRGGHVILEVAPALLPLFKGLSDVDEVRVVADLTIDRGNIDLYIPLLGLPGALTTELDSIPVPIPYLWANDDRIERWRPRLESSAPLRVGIVWAGNAAQSNDRHRSVGLEYFAALGAIDGIAWFGLQKGRDEERRSCGLFTLDPLGSEIGDYGDTAAILTHLDLLIAVDTSVVHLAGALGTPVWTLLPFAGGWRWLVARDDSPWYPTMRLFRQPRAGDWASVFAAVERELRALRGSRRPRERLAHRRRTVSA